MRAEEHRSHHRIVMNPSSMTGKPTVRGTDIPVDSALSHLAENLGLNGLIAAYPRLSVEDVKAVLAYARDAVSHSHSTGAWCHLQRYLVRILQSYVAPTRVQTR